jgi:putative oxidoreductase
VSFLGRFTDRHQVGAIVKVHGEKGFFLQNGGFEYNLVLIGLLATILIAGPGRLAIGRFLPLPKSTRTGRPIIVLE